MKTFGAVGEENKKSTRKKMPKIRLFCSLNVTGILTPFLNLSKQCYNLSCEIEAKNNGEGGDENLNIKFIWPKRQECERKHTFFFYLIII
jgi:hypothetical protein